jgi:peptidyl-prolyl cis-trans isomerase C
MKNGNDWTLKILVPLVGLLIASLSGTAYSQPPERPAGQVALVNGSPISEQDFSREMTKVARQLQSAGRSVSESELPQLKKNVLETLINRELLYQDSRKRGIKVRTNRVEEQIAAVKRGFPSDAEYEKTLERLEISEEEMRVQIKKGMAIEKLIEEKITPGLEVPEKEVKSYYNNRPELFKRPEQVKARHILIKVDPKATESQKVEARKKITEIQWKLKGGEEFAELAKAYSEGPSAPKGGDLGYFGRGKMVKPFEDAAFTLKPGEVSKPVETRFGYHLILVEEKKSASTVSYEEVKEKLEQFLLRQKRVQKVNTYVEKIKGKAQVERFM